MKRFGGGEGGGEFLGYNALRTDCESGGEGTVIIIIAYFVIAKINRNKRILNFNCVFFSI